MGNFEHIEIDPTDLRPGDIVVELGEHEISGCHCDVRVAVMRPVTYPTWREQIASQLREAQRSTPHTAPVRSVEEIKRDRAADLAARQAQDQEWAERAKAPANWTALYEWLGEQAKAGYRDAQENESAANLDACVGPQYMAEGLIQVREHMRRTDPALPYVKAIDNDLC